MIKRSLALFACLVLLSYPAHAQAKGYDGDGPVIIDANEVPASMQPMDAEQQAEQAGETGEIKPPMMHRVTSLQKCLDQLDPVEAAEVKLNTVHPYQECMGRVAERAAERRHLKVTKRKKAEKEEAEAEEAESPRNYRRVTDDKTAAADDDEETAPRKNSTSSFPALEGNYWSSSLKSRRAGDADAKPPQSPEALAARVSGEEEEEESYKSYKTRSIFGWKPSIKSDNSKPSYNR